LCLACGENHLSCRLWNPSQVPTNCSVGNFCPFIGMLSALPCRSGFYCATIGLSVPTGPCDGGYFCRAGAVVGASVPAPTDGVIGAQCQAGTYCPAGSSAPLPCALGGYCASPGLATPTDCTAGFFCGITGIATLPTAQMQCQVGTYCPTGSSAPTPCNAGFFCGQAGMGLASTTPCQAGYFCPTGSVSATQVQCPVGAYCLAQSSAATICTAGYFCGTTGIAITPNDPMKCTAGYYCLPGSSTATYGTCGAGCYCLAGSPSACPAQVRGGGGSVRGEGGGGGGARLERGRTRARREFSGRRPGPNSAPKDCHICPMEHCSWDSRRFKFSKTTRQPFLLSLFSSLSSFSSPTIFSLLSSWHNLPVSCSSLMRLFPRDSLLGNFSHHALTHSTVTLWSLVFFFFRPTCRRRQSARTREKEQHRQLCARPERFARSCRFPRRRRARLVSTARRRA
jgi:hypothetical protein